MHKIQQSREISPVEILRFSSNFRTAISGIYVRTPQTTETHTYTGSKPRTETVSVTKAAARSCPKTCNTEPDTLTPRGEKKPHFLAAPIARTAKTIPVRENIADESLPRKSIERKLLVSPNPAAVGKPYS